MPNSISNSQRLNSSMSPLSELRAADSSGDFTIDPARAAILAAELRSTKAAIEAKHAKSIEDMRILRRMFSSLTPDSKSELNSAALKALEDLHDLSTISSSDFMGIPAIEGDGAYVRLTHMLRNKGLLTIEEASKERMQEATDILIRSRLKIDESSFKTLKQERASRIKRIEALIKTYHDKLTGINPHVIYHYLSWKGRELLSSRDFNVRYIRFTRLLDQPKVFQIAAGQLNLFEHMSNCIDYILGDPYFFDKFLSRLGEAEVVIDKELDWQFADTIIYRHRTVEDPSNARENSAGPADISNKI